MTANLSASTKTRPVLRILLADDNDVFVAAVSGLLRRLGHRVEAVGNGREAVDAATSREYDFMFLDMLMPELGGIEAARSIRERLPVERYSFIVGLPADRDAYRGTSGVGIDDFLLKPVCLSDLVRVLDHPVGS